MSDRHGNCVGVAVRCRTAVLEVAPLVLAHLPRDADAGAAVGDAGGEVVDAGGFVQTREAPHVVLSAVRVVHRDVLLVRFAQLANGLLNVPVRKRREERAGLFLSRN